MHWGDELQEPEHLRQISVGLAKSRVQTDKVRHISNGLVAGTNRREGMRPDFKIALTK
jgi:hypothetical protein